MGDVKDAKLRYSDTIVQRRDLLKAGILCDYRQGIIHRGRARRLLRLIGFDNDSATLLLAIQDSDLDDNG